MQYISIIKVKNRDAIRLHIESKNASVWGPGRWSVSFNFVKRKNEMQGVRMS